jgi:hypothetical protein
MIDILRWHVETQLVADDPNSVKKPRVTRARMAASELLFPSPRTGRFMSTTALWKPFEAVSLAMAEESKDSDKPFTKLITPKGMRRTNKDLMRAAGVRDVVAMAIANHLDEDQHHHYATVSSDEMRDAVAQVIRLADFRKVHETPSSFTRPFSQVRGSEG